MPTADVNGTRLHYVDQGRGLAVVLLHGFPLDGRMWENQIDALAGRYRVIVPDLRGFGQSLSDTPFTIESLADDVYALMKKLGTLPCVLGGLSMGGYVTLALARKCPREQCALMLIDTRAEADTTQAKEGRNKLIEQVRAAGSIAAADYMLPKLLAPDSIQHRPELAAKVRQMMESCPALTVEHALIALRDRPDQTDFLPSIADPTLILVGQQDSITPPAMSEAMHRAIPRSQLAVIPGAGHMAPMEQPQQVNAAILRFIQNLPNKSE